MKRIILSFFSFLFLLVMVAMVVPFFIPVETYKAQVESLIEQKTGRKVELKGDISFALLPNPHLTVQDVTIHNPAGFTRDEMATLKTLDLRVLLAPLLNKKVEITELMLEQPTIWLEKNRSGRANWELGSEPKSSSPNETPSGVGVQSLDLHELKIKDATLVYKDASSAAQYQLNKTNLEVDMRKGQVKADGIYGGEKINLSADMKDYAQFLAGGLSAVELKGEAAGAKLQFTGRASQKETRGEFLLDAPSLNRIGLWAGKKPLLPPGIPDGLKSSGTVHWEDSALNLSPLDARLGDVHAQGNVNINWRASTPLIKAILLFANLDLTPFMGDSDSRDGGGSAAAWSDEKIDFSWVGGFALDAVLKAEAVRFREITLGYTQAECSIKGKQLTVTVPRMELYGGRASGKLELNASGTPVLRQQFVLKDVQAEKLLEDALDSNRLSGALTANGDLTARGNSQREFVSSLGGQARLIFTDGAIKGVNLAAMVRNVKSAFMGDKITEKTDFAELSATIKASNGILSNDDLALKAPALRLAGKGEVNLPARTINYRLEPKIASTLKGQGGKDEVGGVTVPVLVSGTLDNPSFMPDLRSMVEEGLKNPEAIKQTFEGVKGQVKDIEQEVKGLRDLFKKKPVAEPAPKPGLPAQKPAAPIATPVSPAENPLAAPLTKPDIAPKPESREVAPAPPPMAEPVPPPPAAQ